MNNPDTIIIYEGDRPITFTYADLTRYHGFDMPGGVALAFRMMQWAFARLPQPPVRGKCRFYSGLGQNGRGILDSAELVMRVRHYDTVGLDLDYCMDKVGPEAPGGGRYYFEIGCDNHLVKLAVRPDVIPQAFFDLSREAHRRRAAGDPPCPTRTATLAKMREELADAILSLSGDNLFIALD